jgi:hypothetical protein
MDDRSNMTKQTIKIWNPLKKLLKKARMNYKHRRDNVVLSSHSEPPPRSVQFARSDTVYEVMALCEYTAEEIAASWFSNAESELIQKKCCKVIRKMKKYGSDLNENKYCSRGLEIMAGPRMNLKQKNRLKAYIAVLDLQDAQWDCYCEDQEEIAEHYQNVSYQCQIEATCIGEKDELVVLKQNNKMEEQRRRTYIATTA